MQAKTLELEGQLKTLETLLANYEIQHVVGEIDEESYGREISLLSNTLETTRNELGVIKQAIDQIFPSAQPMLQNRSNNGSSSSSTDGGRSSPFRGPSGSYTC